MGAETLVEEDARALGPEPLQGEIEDPGPRSAYWALKNGTLVRLHKAAALRNLANANILFKDQNISNDSCSYNIAATDELRS